MVAVFDDALFDSPREIFLNHQKEIGVKSLRRSQRGQEMTEHVIIVALIAVAAIAVYQYFGSTVRNQTAAIAQELAGSDGTAAKTKAQASATAGAARPLPRKLDTYTNNKAE